MSRAPVEIGDVDAELESFARRLKAARKAAKLSQKALADKSGVSKGMITGIEGLTTNPSLLTVMRIAAGIGIPMHQLFSDDPDA